MADKTIANMSEIVSELRAGRQALKCPDDCSYSNVSSALVVSVGHRDAVKIYDNFRARSRRRKGAVPILGHFTLPRKAAERLVTSR
ncbi:MAG: hypothetical protein NZT92_07605 [Abditibacteriales bacterium]|nr:hypothetical protein [Abditibacteriales bacterium]MDW8365819.1 hypothetical protein [Abditibacteriales bacterium]